MPLLTRWVRTDTFGMILLRLTRHSSRRTFPSRTFGSRSIFHTLDLSRTFWRRSRLRLWFRTLTPIVLETALVSFRTVPWGMPLPTISWSFVNATWFYLTLDQDGGLNISRFWPQNSSFVNSARYFLLPSSSICDNQVQLSSDERISKLHISDTVLSFSDSRILNLNKLSKMSSGGNCSIDNEISSHLVSNCWMLAPRRATVNKSA